MLKLKVPVRVKIAGKLYLIKGFDLNKTFYNEEAIYHLDILDAKEDNKKVFMLTPEQVEEVFNTMIHLLLHGSITKSDRLAKAI